MSKPPSALLARISVRCTKEEHDLVEEHVRAQGMTIQDYVMRYLQTWAIEPQRRATLERAALEEKIARAAARRKRKPAGDPGSGT